MDQSTKSEVMSKHPWVVFGESVDERPPRGVLDELGEPRGRLALLGEDGVGLLGVERLQDHVVQVVLNLKMKSFYCIYCQFTAFTDLYLLIAIFKTTAECLYRMARPLTFTALTFIY